MIQKNNPFFKHGWKIILGGIGLLMVVLFLAIGFWKTLLAFALIGAGVAVGTIWDRRVPFVTFFKKWFGSDDDEF